MDTAELTRFSYWYPDASEAALAGVSMRLGGDITALLGPSGSGKSTLLRVFNGLVPHFHGGTVRGAARVLGVDTLAQPTRRLARDVGLVFQDPELQAVYPTVERDVAFGPENLGVPRAAMIDRVEEALEVTGITELRQRAVNTLSGGERQRLALAGVLALRPRILLLDEPLSQLDGAGASSLMRTLQELARNGTAIVMSEHRLEAAVSAVTRRLHMDGGRLVDGVSADATPVLVRSPAATPPRDNRAQWQLSGVTAGIGRTPVLHGVDLEGCGNVLVLMGANGSGKTTLLRTLAGLLPPLSGSVVRPAGRIAYLPQNPTALLHRPTVRAELEWTVRHTRGDPAPIDGMLSLFGLTGVAGRYPRDLSGGQRQRTALAAVLVGAPRLALLDEPTRGMDAFARAALCRAVWSMRDRGTSVVIATHDEELCRLLADRVVRVGDGRVHESRAEAVSA